MLKGFIKISLLGLALTAVAVIPGNSKLVFGYGGSVAGSTTEAPVCSKEKPAQVLLYEPNHSLLPKATNPNEVRLNWLKTEKASKYTIAFGLSSGNYIYGLPDVGNTDNFTVGSLSPRSTYYFVVRGVNDCMPGPWSREWSVRVGGGAGVALLTNTNTNSPLVVTPPNTPPNTQPNLIQLPATGTTPQDLQASPTAPAYTPPLPTPTPLGFFQGLWKGFLGIFGK